MANYRVHNPRSAPTTPPRLPATQFWGLVVIIWMVLQMPVARIPIEFLSTWAHELGHGVGALITGGGFEALTVFPDFSGLARTLTTNDFQRAMVIFIGLLGPSLMGVLMIFMTRALHKSRLAVAVLAGLLALSLIWAADSFTVAILLIGAVILGVSAWKLPAQIIHYVAHIIAIALCLNALTGFGYFFIGNGEIGGSVYRSDTGVLSDVIGGPYWFWGMLMVVVSVAILVAGVWFSDRIANRSNAKDKADSPWRR